MIERKILNKLTAKGIKVSEAVSLLHELIDYGRYLQMTDPKTGNELKFHTISVEGIGRWDGHRKRLGAARIALDYSDGVLHTLAHSIRGRLLYIHVEKKMTIATAKIYAARIIKEEVDLQAKRIGTVLLKA